MNNFQRLTAILFLLMGLLACSDGTSAESKADAVKAQAAVKGFPSMGVPELEQYLQAHKGKPTMLMFWATWCPSCKQALPDMEKLAQTQGETVNVLSVSVDENKDALKSFYKNREPGIPVYHGDQTLSAKFDVTAIPTMVFFNKEGEPVFARPGAFPYDMLSAMAQKLAAE